MADGMTFEMSVPISIHWRGIELLRVSILNCLGAIFHNQDFGQTVSTVASELLENAVKYGNWQGDAASFRLRVCGVGNEITIEVSNPVTPQQSDELKSVMNWLHSFNSAREAYFDRVRQLADEKSSASKLGLARIAYETDCRIEALIKNGVATLRATASTAGVA